MRLMAQHGAPLTALIRDEFRGDAMELLLVRCRWAATDARRRTLAARTSQLLVPPPSACVAAESSTPTRIHPTNEGGDKGTGGLHSWAVLIASTSAASMGALCEAYRSTYGGAADLHADVHAHASQSGHVRELLIALLLRQPTPHGRSTTNGAHTAASGQQRDANQSLNGQIAAGDAIEDCPSGGTYKEDGPADVALAEIEADELLGIASWHMVCGVGGAGHGAPHNPRSPPNSSRSARGGSRSPPPSLSHSIRAKAEAAVLALLGRSSYAQLAAIEVCMARRLAAHNSTTRSASASSIATKFRLPACSPGDGALLQWASATCPQLHPTCRLVLEQRFAKAMAPATTRAERLRHV